MIPSTTRNLFFSVLSDAEQNIDLFVNSPGSDMTRHRCCSFSDTVLMTLSLNMERTNTELFNYFHAKKMHIPSKSALTQQRKKLNSQFFPYLLKEFNKRAPFKKTFKGYHLMASDGSDLNLPTDRNDTLYRIKQARSDNYYYQMHINALFDICENRYHSLKIQPRSQMNEHAAFLELVGDGDFAENTIFIADRGYCSLNTIANLYSRNRLFLIRAKAPASGRSFLCGLMDSATPCDCTVSLAVSRNRNRLKAKDYDAVKIIRNDRRFDLIATEDYESLFIMNLRCTCIELSDGSYEYLVSNLPMSEFSASELKELYWKRWSIETSFRSLKYALSLSYLHSLNRELIVQEIYAKVVLYNFTSLIHAFAQVSKELLERNSRNKHKSNISFDDAVPIAKSLLISNLKNGIIKTLLLRHLTSVRVVASSARQVRSQTVNSLNNRA